jgi:hypothetical protein
MFLAKPFKAQSKKFELNFEVSVIISKFLRNGHSFQKFIFLKSMGMASESKIVSSGSQMSNSRSNNKVEDDEELQGSFLNSISQFLYSQKSFCFVNKMSYFELSDYNVINENKSSNCVN